MLKSEGFIILASFLLIVFIFILIQFLEIKNQFEKTSKFLYSKYFEEVKNNFLREVSYVSDISFNDSEILKFLNYSFFNFNFFNSFFISIFVNDTMNINLYNYANSDIKNVNLNCTNNFYISKISTFENYSINDFKCNVLKISFDVFENNVKDEIEIRGKRINVFYIFFKNDEFSINKIIKYYE